MFREGKDGQQDMDVAILQALLKGEGQAKRGCGGGATVLVQRSQKTIHGQTCWSESKWTLPGPPHTPPGQVVPVTDVGV